MSEIIYQCDRARVNITPAIAFLVKNQFYFNTKVRIFHAIAYSHVNVDLKRPVIFTICNGSELNIKGQAYLSQNLIL